MAKKTKPKNTTGQYLSDLYKWLQSSNPEKDGLEFPSLLPYPSKYVLEVSDTNLDACVICDLLYNDKIAGHSIKATEAARVAKSIANGKSMYQTHTLLNPYNLGPIMKEIELWKKIRILFPQLSNQDKEMIFKLYSKEELSNMVSNEQDIVKSKNGGNYYMNSPTTKGELIQYIYNFIPFVCGKCDSFKQTMDNVVIGDAHNQNWNNKLSDIKVLFVGECPATEEIKYKLPFVGQSGTILRNCINAAGFNMEDYFISNACLCFHSPGNQPTGIELLNCFPYLDKIISFLPKNCLIVPVGAVPMKRFGIFGKVYESANEIYKYDDYVVSPIPHPSGLLRQGKREPEYLPYLKLIKELVDKAQTSKIRVKSENHSQSAAIKLYYSKNKDVNTNDSNDVFSNEIVEVQQVEPANTETLPKKIVTASQAFNNMNQNSYEEYFSQLEEGWSIINIGQKIENIESKKFGNRIERKTPYLVIRKGDQKRIVKADPKIDIFYTTNSVYKIIEDRDNLCKIDQVPYFFIKGTQKKIEDQLGTTNITWYNTDLPLSVYVLSKIRNEIKYKESENQSPRVCYLDIETESAAIKVKAIDNTTQAKLRLITLYDSFTEAFTCIVRREDSNRSVDLSDIKMISDDYKDDHGKIFDKDYKVNIVEVKDEREMFVILNKYLEILDPDIITGWNVESFDLSYLIVRGKTLGISLRNKYSDFTPMFVRSKIGNGYYIFADGSIVMDYLQLYKNVNQNRQENYRLDFICKSELKSGKKELNYDHDTMYNDHLREYVLYNIIDVLRVVQLERKLNYIKFEMEICKICNISLHEIYAKTKQIDGLVYNYINKFNKVVKTKNYSQHDEESDDPNSTASNNKKYKGAIVLQAQPDVYDIIADLDLKSLYPHIMIRYNLIKDTLLAKIDEELAETWLYNRNEFPEEFTISDLTTPGEPSYNITKEFFTEYLKDKILTMYGTIYYKPQVMKSSVSEILIYLMNKRDEYKLKLKNARVNNEEDMMDRYEVIQMAYKQLANSIYGVMGTSSYRLSDFNTASSITASGRELTRIGAYYVSKYIDSIIENGTIDVPHSSVPITVTHLDGLEEIEKRKNVIYGDTDSIFIKIFPIINKLYPNITDKNERMKLAWEAIKSVSNYINNYVIYDILNKKGIDPEDEFSKYNFLFKEEYIMSRAIFMDKKKTYGLHLAINNGVPYDKIKITGGEAKKSDYPKFTRDMVSKYYEYILKHYDPNNKMESNKTIMNSLNEKVKEYVKLLEIGSPESARPVSLTQDIKEYANAQSHIKGMILYSILYDYEFKVGSKGYSFSILNVDWEKFGISRQDYMNKMKKLYSKTSWYQNMKNFNIDTIVIPAEVDLLDVNAFLIDKDEMINFSIYNRVRDLFKTVGITCLTEAERQVLKKTSSCVPIII